MNRDVFMIFPNEVRPFFEPSPCPRGDDVLSVEKQLTVTLYYLKDQRSILMTSNAFGVAFCTVSVVVRKVCTSRKVVPGRRVIPSTAFTRQRGLH